MIFVPSLVNMAELAEILYALFPQMKDILQLQPSDFVPGVLLFTLSGVATFI